MNRLSGSILLGALLVWGAVLIALEGEGLAQQSESGVLTLRQAVQMAVQKAPDVALAQAQEARLHEALEETRSLNRPQVVIGTGLAYNNGFPLSIEGAAPSIVQVGVTQSIFNKKNKNLILEAEQSSKASKLTLESIRNNLVAKAALTYCQLHQVRKLAELWAMRLQALVKDQEITGTLLEAGKVKPLDLTLAQAATAYAQQQVLIAGEQARVAAVELREMTGLSEGMEIHTEEPVLDAQWLSRPGDDLFLKALEMHPDILQAESEIRVREFRVEAAKGEFLPRMELVGQYALFAEANNYADYFSRFTRNNYLVGLSVQLPVFDGSRTSSRLAQSRQEVSEARYRLQQAKSNLKLEIERSISALRIANGASRLALSELAASQESLQINETLYEGGRINLKDLEAARTQLRERQIAQIDCEKALFQRKIELLIVTGTLSEIF
jgi:outer membrane protein